MGIIKKTIIIFCLNFIEFMFCLYFLSFSNIDLIVFWISLFLFSFMYQIMIIINRRFLRYFLIKIMIIGFLSFMIPFLQVWYYDFITLIKWFSKIETYFMILISLGISLFIFSINYFILMTIKKIHQLKYDHNRYNK